MTVPIDRVIGALLLLVALLLGLLLVSGARRGRGKQLPHREPASTPKPAARERAPATPPADPTPDVAGLDEDVTQVYVRAQPALLAVPARTAPGAPVESAEVRQSDSRVKLAFEVDAEEEETTSPLARLLITAKGDSDCGKRRKANEDCLLFLPEQSLFGVADGMGGYRGGQVASSLAVETVRESFERERFVGRLSADKPLPRRGQELASAVLQANWAVFESARRDPQLSQMGTTLVAARFSPNKQRVYIANVGDSRCYRLRGGRLRQLTTDQTMRLIGLQGPGANDLLQAIGVTSDLAIDLLVDRPEPNDVYLLCSDGLPKMVKDEEIEQVLNGEPDLDAAVYGLIERANDYGGKDNVTVVLVKVVERPVSALVPNFRGWSKLPDAMLASATSEEALALDTATLDEPTVIGVRRKAEARRGA